MPSFLIWNISHTFVFSAIKGNTFSVPLDEKWVMEEKKNCETVYAESFDVITTAVVIYFPHKMYFFPFKCSIPHFSFNLSSIYKKK